MGADLKKWLEKGGEEFLRGSRGKCRVEVLQGAAEPTTEENRCV